MSGKQHAALAALSNYTHKLPHSAAIQSLLRTRLLSRNLALFTPPAWMSGTLSPKDLNTISRALTAAGWPGKQTLGLEGELCTSDSWKFHLLCCNCYQTEWVALNTAFLPNMFMARKKPFSWDQSYLWTTTSSNRPFRRTVTRAAAGCVPPEMLTGTDPLHSLHVCRD